MRGLTPRQRDYNLQEKLNDMLKNADFSNVTLTPADDLSLPMKLTAQFASSDYPSPRTGFPVDSYFAAPNRNRPLEINNGQKLHLIQTIDSPDPMDTTPPTPYDQKVAGIEAMVSYQSHDGGQSRTAELIIDNPVVAPADYAKVRQMLREWNDWLSP
jgi:hypothetical protein